VGDWKKNTKVNMILLSCVIFHNLSVKRKDEDYVMLGLSEEKRN